MENLFERYLFRSRWLLAPFYAGLVIALVAVLFAFARETISEIPLLWTSQAEDTKVTVWLLSLIDLSLSANLTLMVVLAGYENFISKIEVAQKSVDKPSWLGRVDFSNMKLKLVATIIAISVIDLLKQFISIEEVDLHKLPWLIALHVVFLVSGLVLALMDFLGERGSGGKEADG